jgi:HAD superfamily hydrolase (TIGR01509 family)
MIACLIFDCDGTLVDSERLCMEAFVSTLSLLDVVLEVDDCLIRYRGWQVAAMIADVERRMMCTIGDEFIPKYRQREHELLDQLRPISGVLQALTQLTLPKCVASSGPLNKIKHSLQTTGLSHYFSENLFSSYEIQRWKPEPDIFLHAAKTMGFLPSQCAVIEDSWVGVEAALAAQMNVFYFCPHQGAATIHGVTTFQKMDDLPALILS